MRPKEKRTEATQFQKLASGISGKKKKTCLSPELKGQMRIGDTSGWKKRRSKERQSEGKKGLA